jgi:putative aldouronate transport system permease protein
MNVVSAASGPSVKKRTRLLQAFSRDLKVNKYLYLLILPVVAYYLIFCYAPMYGIIIAFKDFSPMKGIMGSSWVGFRYFEQFFSSIYAFRTIKNTLLLSLYSLLWGFPAPIILALLLNEVKNVVFKKTVQTITYLPHFISLIVVCGLIVDFTQQQGLINNIISSLGGQRIPLLQKPEWFRTMYISTGIWQSVGWNSIIYLAALAGVDQQLYEAASIDGAGRWKQIFHITLPGIAPTIIILLIMDIGHLMSVGYEKVILLYNPLTYSTADIISSFVYRMGLQQFNYGYATAVGLFNSVVNLLLLVAANSISRKVSETSLW